MTDTPGTDLMSIEAELKRELAAIGGTVDAPSSNKISTKGKVFTLPDGKSGAGPLNLIILDSIVFNQYFQGAYDPKQKAPPKCWALGRIVKEMKPSAQVPKAEGTDCESCPRAQWGTGANGKGKACKNQRRLLVLPPNFTAADEPSTLYVSPTGLKGWNKYVDKDLAQGMGLLPVQVITEITFDPNQSYPTLTFKYLEKHGRIAEAMAIRAKYQDILFKEPEVKST